MNIKNLKAKIITLWAILLAVWNMPFLSHAQSTVHNLFEYIFSDHTSEEFSEDWTAIDADGDGESWEFNQWVTNAEGNLGVAACYGSYIGECTNDDYLITPPIALESGTNHITFSVRGGYGDNVESLEVWISDNLELTDMKLIYELTVQGSEWISNVSNFLVEETGEYYIAFRDHSVNGGMICLDNITVGKGYKTTSPALSIERLLLPVSNCDLSDNCQVGALIKNKGTAAAQQFILSYEISGPEGDVQTASETFLCEIQPNDTQVVYFDRTADFSDIGVYTIVTNGSCEGQEISSIRDEIHALTPEPTPFITDFTQGDLGEWNEVTPGSWVYESYGPFYACYDSGQDNALLSRCFEVEKKARVKVHYSSTGRDNVMMHIAIGKAGAPLDAYVTVFEDYETLGENLVEFDYPVDETDHYSLLIVNDGESLFNALYLYSVEITNVQSYDIAINHIEMALSPYTPIGQIGEAVPIAATIANKGLETAHNVKITAYDGDTKIGESLQVIDLSPDHETIINFYINLGNGSLDDVIDLSFKASMNEPDQNPEDNIYETHQVKVTETLRANEDLNDYTYGVGQWGETIAIGNVFDLAYDDVITAIEFALSPTDDDETINSEIGIALYSLTENYDINACYYHTSLIRGNGGMTTISLEPILLQAGKYYFEIEQQSTTNMGLVYALMEGSSCYQRTDGTLNRVDNDLALLIRARFEDKEALAFDAAVVNIIYPQRAYGLFSKEQSIVANFRNNGYQTAEFYASCSLNGTELDNQFINIPPYQNISVALAVCDMSKPGPYTIEIETHLAEDQKIDNNKFTLIAVADEEASPYRLDFENCYDFDAANEIFNPRWRTVDRLNHATNYYWAYKYPYRGEPAGFIAFNPNATQPSMIQNDFEGFIPHSGERFGAAFSPGIYNWDEDSQLEADTWLISPKLNLGTGSELELYVKTRTQEYDGQLLEPYQLLISTTDDDFDSFEVIGVDVREAPVEWTQVKADLALYDNESVYVAIRYIGSALSNVALMVDDINVNTTLSLVSSPCNDNLIRIEVFNNNGIKVGSFSPSEKWDSLLKAGLYIVRFISVSSVSTSKVWIK